MGRLVSINPAPSPGLTIEEGELSFTVATQAELDAHTGDTSAAHAASAISYAGATGISATDVEAALDEVALEAKVKEFEFEFLTNESQTVVVGRAVTLNSIAALAGSGRAEATIDYRISTDNGATWGSYSTAYNETIAANSVLQVRCVGLTGSNAVSATILATRS